MENEEKKEKKEIYEKWWVWAILIVIAISAVVIKMIEPETETKKTSESTNKNTTVRTSTTPTITKTRVTIIDFSTMEKAEIESWCNTNKVKCNFSEEYSDVVEKGLFVSQSIKPDTIVYEGDRITITYSLGKEPSLGQKNALKSAKDYIKIMPFSYKGLIKQLKYEGYSDEEAIYGADNCEADWNEQAVKSAKGYISTMSFSRSGLIKQLKYEGFTNEQAQYGVTSVGY